MTGDIFDGHRPTQFQDLAGKGPGVAALTPGEGHLHLPDDLAAVARHAGDGHLDKHRLACDRQVLKGPHDLAASPYVVRAAPAVVTIKILIELNPVNNDATGESTRRCNHRVHNLTPDQESDSRKETTDELWILVENSIQVYIR